MTDLEWAIGLNRLMLRIIGLWPPDNKDRCDVIRSKLCLLYTIITFLFTLMIPSLMSLLRVYDDMILMIDNLQYTLPLLVTILKIYIIWNKQGALTSLTDMIERDWIKVKMIEEQDVMLRFGLITRRIAMCGMFTLVFAETLTIALSCFGISTRHVTNLTDPGKSLPLPLYYLHDVSKSPQFELTLVAQGFGMFTAGLSYSAVDNLLSLLVIHVCGQLKNLHWRLTHMERFPSFDTALKYNVREHNRLIRSIEIIDDIFDLMLLGLIVCFGIGFCLQGFLVANVVKQKGQLSLMQLVWLMTSILFMLLHMSLYCAVGEFLVIQSERIHDAAYEYPWYALEPKAAKNFMLIMLRSNKILHITAGKTFPMTMATLCNLLKTSASYISVLLATQDCW